MPRRTPDDSSRLRYNLWQIVFGGTRLEPVVLFFSKRQSSRPLPLIPLFLFFTLLCAGAVPVAFSIQQMNGAEAAVERLLEQGILPAEDSALLTGLSSREQSRLFRRYDEAELMAAGLLLEENPQGAELFLGALAKKDSPLGAWAEEELLRRWAEQSLWRQIAAYAARREEEGRSSSRTANRFWQALRMGDLSLADYPAPPPPQKSPWSRPNLDRRGLLSREDYILFLLSTPWELLQEILQSWEPSYGKDPGAAAILRGRALLAERRYGEAEALFRELWEEEFAPLPGLPGGFLSDLGSLIRRTERGRGWTPLLEEWDSPDREHYRGAFFLGAVYEGAGDSRRAGAYYGKAAELAHHSPERRRGRWYQLRQLIRSAPAEVPAFLGEHAPRWEETDYFDDLLDEYYSLTIRSGAWEDLRAAVAVLAESKLCDAAMQGIVLVERAVADGRLRRGIDPGLKDRICRASRLSYYSLVDAPSDWPFGPPAAEDSPLMPLTEEEKPIEDVYKILLRAGALERALLLWNERKDALGFETVEMICHALYKKGEFYRCIQFVGYWFYRWPDAAAAHLTPWLYPIDRELPVNEYSRRYGQPQELVWGIIRRESAFHRTIRSHAGAVGLMQLMPSTAEDLAARYKVPEWDLATPRDNLRFGVLYLDWLQERPWTENRTDMLAAYNGGGGNLRRWKRRFGHLEEQLFIQAIPFRETRNYVRKVIVAAGSYRYLYTGMPPGKWIDRFFLPFSAADPFQTPTNEQAVLQK